MMTLKRKLFFIGFGNMRTGASQLYKGLTNISLRKGNLQNMTGAQRRASVMSGLGNLGKGALKFGVGTTAIAGGTALLAGNALKNMATDG